MWHKLARFRARGAPSRQAFGRFAVAWIGDRGEHGSGLQLMHRLNLAPEDAVWVDAAPAERSDIMHRHVTMAQNPHLCHGGSRVLSLVAPACDLLRARRPQARNRVKVWPVPGSEEMAAHTRAIWRRDCVKSLMSFKKANWDAFRDRRSPRATHSSCNVSRPPIGSPL